ncbi:MAG: NUDIX domain-containing protein [Candidatus Aminicenantes bacterium]|nr:NUDIX domain-containing protein [Candidatus Aminicenantes bacterium]
MRLSAGIIIVRKEKSHWKYLFLRAYNKWDFPKGEVESQENPLATALREAKEESGISELKFKWGHKHKETEPYRGGKKKARYYIAETTRSKVTFSINPELGRPEHHEYRWVSYKELKKLAPARLQPIINWAHKTVDQQRS